MDTEITIKPSKGFSLPNLRELWHFRELLYFFVWRDLKVRYKQTLLGVAWAVIQPIAGMIVFTLIFGKLAKMPSDGIPYPIFAYSGLLAWQLFSRALTESSISLVANGHILNKIFFPRIIAPLSTIFSSTVDFFIALIILFGMMAYYRIYPGWQIFTLPFFLFFALTTSAAVGILFSALDVQYRDIRYTLPFLTQFWMFATPVVYPSSLVPEKWRWLYGLNPMSGVVEGFRFALLGKPITSVSMLFVSAGTVVLLLFACLIYFKHVEKNMADIL